MLTVDALMTRTLVVLRESDRLARVKEVLHRHQVHHLPVTLDGQPHGVLVGLVTHHDLLRALTDTALDHDALWVGDLMRRNLATVGPKTSVRDAIGRMLEHHYGCLPVVESDGRLLGLLTETDLLRHFARLVERVDLQETAYEWR